MTQFDEKTIRETAYYIWKNNGCPANSSTHDWNAAIEQLEQRDAGLRQMRRKKTVCN